MNRDLHKYAAQQIHGTEYGPRLVLLAPGTKIPAIRGWVDHTVSVAEIEWAFRRQAYNLGLKTGDGLIVADYESEGAMAEARRLGVPASPMFSITARFRHEFFRTTVEGPTRIKWRGLDMDLKRSGQVMIPPSWRSDVEIRYQWGPNGMVPIAQLPEFPAELLKETKSEVSCHLPVGCQLDRQDDTLIRYVEKIEPAVSGAGGSRQTIVALLKILSLVRGDVERAWPLAVLYSRRCEPPWDEEAESGADSLKRKLREAARMWKTK